MLFHSIKYIFFLLILVNFIHADTIDISKTQADSLLPHTQVYLDDQQRSLENVIEKELFLPYHQEYINIGASQKTVWVSLVLNNSSDHPIRKLLLLSSSLTEYIALYNEHDLQHPDLKGMSYIAEDHDTLLPYFSIELPAHATQHLYLEIKSTYNPVDFGLYLLDKEVYLKKDTKEQLVNIFLLGIVFALMLYSLLLAFYTDDKSYAYYSIYLLMLIYQQMTYLGLTQIHLPLWFAKFDIHLTVIKINLLIITAALYSIHFLKIKEIPFLYKGYKVIMLIALIEMIVLYLPGLYNLDIVIVTGTFFILFNLWAGVYSYKRGYKQARLFILGFGIVFVSYLFIILDALGISSIMQDFKNILMISTVFEAFVLTLAFTDRYTLLQKEKEKVDARIMLESKNRTEMIQKEVVAKTKELHQALESKELLLKEVHHRVKNNLQIILSMIRLQNDDIEDEKITEKFTHLENRINAISKTYNMLLIKDDLEEIDMDEYIRTLVFDIQASYNYQIQNIDIQTDIDAVIPLRESVYIGLIVNELVTNSYKYAFDGNNGHIFISLRHDKNNYTLSIEDDGKGFTPQNNSKNLGLKLIHTLVYDQLDGEMDISTNGHTKYTIRFTL